MGDRLSPLARRQSLVAQRRLSSVWGLSHIWAIIHAWLHRWLELCPDSVALVKKNGCPNGTFTGLTTGICHHYKIGCDFNQFITTAINHVVDTIALVLPYGQNCIRLTLWGGNGHAYHFNIQCCCRRLGQLLSKNLTHCLLQIAQTSSSAKGWVSVGALAVQPPAKSFGLIATPTKKIAANSNQPDNVFLPPPSANKFTSRCFTAQRGTLGGFIISAIIATSLITHTGQRLTNGHHHTSSAPCLRWHILSSPLGQWHIDHIILVKIKSPIARLAVCSKGLNVNFYLALPCCYY